MEAIKLLEKNRKELTEEFELRVKQTDKDPIFTELILSNNELFYKIHELGYFSGTINNFTMTIAILDRLLRM